MWARLRLGQFCLLLLAAAPIVLLWFIFGLAIPAASVYRLNMLDPLYDFYPSAAASFRYATWVGWIWDFAVPAACAAICLSWLMGVIRPIWQRRGIRVCWILSVVNYLLALTAITVHAGLVTHLARRLSNEKSELQTRCATFGLLETQLTPEAVRDEYAWEGDPAAMILPDSSTFDEYDLQDLIFEYRRVVRSRTAPPNLCRGILATVLNLLAEQRKETDKMIWVDLHLDLQFYSNGEYKPETDFAEWWATARDRPEWQPLPFYSLQKDPNSFRKDRDPIFDAQKLRHFFWSPESLKYLTTRLKEGMDPNLRDEHGENKDALLTYAARHRRWQAMEMLLEAGADVNIRSVETIQTETINTPNVKFEMQRGTFGGKTPLFFAASLEGSDIVEFLIKHGADVNAIDDAGNNALWEAIRTDRVETVRILLDAGCNPDQRNNDGKSMRELSVEVGYPKIKEMLMIKDAESPAK